MNPSLPINDIQLDFTDEGSVDSPSGTYTVKVSAPGFATTTASYVSVAVGRNMQLNLTLGITGDNQSVNVTASQGHQGSTSIVIASKSCREDSRETAPRLNLHSTTTVSLLDRSESIFFAFPKDQDGDGGIG